MKVEMIEVYQFLSGATAAECLIVAFLFWRGWKKTEDLFFKFFSFAFYVLGIERFALIVNAPYENSPTIYLLRLSAFLLIIWAVIEKNRRVSST